MYPDYLSQSYNESNKKSANLYVERLNQYGFNVKAMSITLDPPGPALNWKELDLLWKIKSKKLFELYDEILIASQDVDAVINAAGINLHPEFVKKIDKYTIFQCFDDPENSKNLSKPVVHSYDLCLVGNIAEVDKYLDWGAKNAVWHPMGILPERTPKKIDVESIKESTNRNIPAILIADFKYSSRKNRLSELVKLVPEGRYYGPGSRDGYLPENEVVQSLLKSRIGFNVHNSTGPVNARTFYLPACGVLQICDNTNYLKKVFKIDEEVIGADSVRDMAAAYDYYSQNVMEQRQIAYNGAVRVYKEYNEKILFDKIISKIDLQTKKNKEIKSIKIRKDVKYSILNLVSSYFLFMQKEVYKELIKIKKQIFK